MGIDTSMYGRAQAPDIMGNIQQGMKIREFVDQKNEDRAIKDLRSKYTTKNPDGTTKFDQGGYVKELAGINPDKAMQAKQLYYQSNQIDQQSERDKWGHIAQLTKGVKDQKSYEFAINEALKNGYVQPGEMPPRYEDGKGMIDQAGAKAMTFIQSQEQDNKTRQLDIEQGKVDADKAKAAAQSKKDQVTIAASLRGELAGLPTSKATQAVSASFNRIQEAARKPSAAGDLALIFNYMKMLDPGSTVREGEFASAQNATGVPERIVNLYNSLKRGERLNENQRKDFINQAQGQYRAQMDQQEKLNNQYAGYASQAGIGAKDVVLDFGANMPAQQRPIGSQAGASGNWGMSTANAAPRTEMVDHTPFISHFEGLSDKELKAKFEKLGQ